jgi:CheY-like chemotaxis protein
MNSVKPITILLAEDSPDDVYFFRRALQKSGLEVVLHVVETGQEAIDYLAHRNSFANLADWRLPDLMFVDLKMPEVSGFDVLEWTTKKLEGPPCTVVVLTSSDEPRDYKRALDLGANAYYLKPISAGQLSALFKKFITSTVNNKP